MRRKIKGYLKKIASVALAAAMTTTLFSGVTLGYAADITSVSHTYTFTDNTGKEVPVKGKVLDGTTEETSGIMYSEESTNNVTFDANLLKFRSGAVLYLPIQNDTTKITYSQTCNGDANDRPTYVGSDEDTYQVVMKKAEQNVTIDDITDYIKTVGNQKYIAIYSHGDVKVTKIKLTEYNPVNEKFC